MPGSMSSRNITFYLIMCIHPYCTFHPKPGHVSAIRKGKNMFIKDSAEAKVPVKFNESLTLKGWLWLCLSLNLGIF